jgi:hypothetical protein
LDQSLLPWLKYSTTHKLVEFQLFGPGAPRCRSGAWAPRNLNRSPTFKNCRTAAIGTFKKTGTIEFTGEIVTRSVEAKGVHIVPDGRATGENAPGHRLLVAECIKRSEKLCGALTCERQIACWSPAGSAPHNSDD